MEKEKKTLLKQIIELLGTLIIGVLIIILLAVATRRPDMIDDPIDMYEDEYSYQLANENLIKLLEYNLKGDGYAGAEVSRIISLSYDDVAYQLDVTGYVCQEGNDDRLIETKVQYTTEYNIEKIIHELGKEEEFKANQYTCVNEYLLIGNKEQFITNSNFKTDFTTDTEKGVVGVKDGINPEYYYYQTYKKTVTEVISINGLKFDGTNYEYSKLNIKKVDALKSENLSTYNLLFFIS